MRTYYVYIVASSTCTFYVGVTNDLERRVFEHAEGANAPLSRMDSSLRSE